MAPRTPAGPLRRAAAAIMAVAVALGLAVAAPVRRLAGAAKAGGDGGPRSRWHSLFGMLSMQRARALGPVAPAGQQARELPWESIQGHPGYAISVERVIAIFGQAEGGWPREQCDLFDDLVEGNCHVRSLFEQRSQAVAGKPFVVQAGGGAEEDKIAARALSAALARLPMIGFFTHQLTANKYGFAASEIDWGLMEFEGRTWVVPTCLADVKARRFAFDIATNTLRLLTVAEPARGEELIPGKWVVTTRPGPLARAGLMRSATFPLCYIRFGTRDWVIYSHKFGLPLVIAQYDDSNAPDDKATDDPTRQVLQDVVKNVGQDGGAVLPKSATVTVTATSGGDASKTQGSLIGYCNAELSKLVVGSTLTNDNAGSGGASYALGEVHASVRWDNITFDAAALEEAFRTQIAAAFVHYNGLAGVAPPLLRMQVVRDLSPMQRAQVAAIYVNQLGGKASATQMDRELGFDAPIDAADILPGMKPAAAQAPALKEAA